MLHCWKAFVCIHTHVTLLESFRLNVDINQVDTHKHIYRYISCKNTHVTLLESFQLNVDINHTRIEYVYIHL